MTCRERRPLRRPAIRGEVEEGKKAREDKPCSELIDTVLALARAYARIWNVAVDEEIVGGRRGVRRGELGRWALKMEKTLTGAHVSGDMLEKGKRGLADWAPR